MSSASRARLVGDLGDPGLSRLLVPLVLRESDAGCAAIESLVALTSFSTGLSPEAFDSSLGWDYVPHEGPVFGIAELHAATATLLATFADHRHREVLRCALALLSPASVAFPSNRAGPLAAWFDDPEPASHMALRAELKKLPGEFGRIRAWQWLGRAPVSAAALDRISQAGTQQEHESMLRFGHLASNPKRASRLGIVQISGRKTARIVPEQEHVEALSDAARLGYIRVIARLKVDTRELDRRLEQLLCDAQPRVRLAAMLAAPAKTLSDFCFDPEPSIAHAAFLRAEADPEPEKRQIVARSPHERVRALANEPKAPVRERLEWRLRLESDGSETLAELRQRLSQRETQETLDTLAIVRHLRLASDVELELLSLAAKLAPNAAETRALATIASLLGECTSDAAEQSLRALLSQGDDRVRSNAAEAMARRSRRSGKPLPSSIIELKGDASHRVRGGVLRAMLLESHEHARDAASGVRAMLEHEHPLQRLAGLWVIERGTLGGRVSELEPLGSAVAKLARDEPEPLLRARARACASILISSLRGKWSGRAPALQSPPTCPLPSDRR